MGRMGEGETYTTIFGIITFANIAQAIYGIAVGGQIFEATDPGGIGPAVGDRVLADYIPGSGQWSILVIVP